MGVGAEGSRGWEGSLSRTWAPGCLWDTRCPQGQNHLENTPEKKDKTPTFNIVEYLCQVKVTFLKKYK